MTSMARIFGAPVIEPPGNEAASRSKASRPSFEAPGDRRDEVLDGARPLQPAESRDPDRAAHADAAEVVAQDVHDHHVLGAILRAGQELAGEGAVGFRRGASRARALDRVRGHAARPHRAPGMAPGWPTGAPAAPRDRGTRHGSRGHPSAAADRRAMDRPSNGRHQPTGHVCLVDLAAGDLVHGHARPWPRRSVDRGRRRRQSGMADDDDRRSLGQPGRSSH